MTTFREALVSDLGTARRKISHIENRLDDLGGRRATDSDLAQSRDFVNRTETVFQALEMMPPAPLPHDSYRSFRADSLSRLQRYIPDKTLAKVDVHKLSRMDDKYVDHFEKEIVSAAQAVANNPNVGSFNHPGQLREVPVKNQAGRTWTEYRGSPMTWMRQFMYPARCVTAVYHPTRGKIA